MRTLVLLGGGHAHLAVLHALARARPDSLRVQLITPEPVQTYSGMLPGWIAGHYRLDDCQIDLRPLAERANVELILSAASDVNAPHQRVTTAAGQYYDYHLLSIDIGSETPISTLLGCGERLLPLRPLPHFLQQWPVLLAEAAQKDSYQVAIVGGGAAGVEVAFAVNKALQRINPHAQVHLIAPTLLEGHSAPVIKRVAKALQSAQIQWHPSRAVGVAAGLVLEPSQTLLRLDKVIAATGAKPSAWLRNSGLQLDSAGFIFVDGHHQSVSHPQVFAAGDICSRAEPNFQRSGVHAVHAGKTLAHNLLSSCRHQTLQNYQPKPRSLYLLATQPKHAIASWGQWSASGAWVWYWKDWIDRGFIRAQRR